MAGVFDKGAHIFIIFDGILASHFVPILTGICEMFKGVQSLEESFASVKVWCKNGWYTKQ